MTGVGGMSGAEGVGAAAEEEGSSVEADGGASFASASSSSSVPAASPARADTPAKGLPAPPPPPPLPALNGRTTASTPVATRAVDEATTRAEAVAAPCAAQPSHVAEDE